jgi:hypothetical protein
MRTSSPTQYETLSYKYSNRCKLGRRRGPHSADYEEIYRLGYNAVQSVEIQRTLQRTRDPSAGYLLHVDFLLSLYLNPEDGGDTLLRNID